MRTRAFKLCLEHWKLVLPASLTTVILTSAANYVITTLLGILGLATIPLLGPLLSTAASAGITILLFPLTTGLAYILLNLWQCAPASYSQLFIFFRNPALRSQVWIMGAIVSLIQCGISLVYRLVSGLFTGSILGVALLVPCAIAVACVSVFFTMRFFMVPLLFLADPTLPAPQCPRASYNLMRGRCWSTFGFMFVTMLTLIPIIIVFLIGATVLGISTALPSLLLGGGFATFTSSFVMVLLSTLLMAFASPYLDLCSTAYCIENNMNHPEPPPVDRFENL